MRKFLFLIIANSSVFFELQAEKLTLSVQAESAILINADTSAILYEKEAHALHYPASITKIATALYALKEAPELDVLIAADQDCVGTVTEEALRRSNYTLPAYLLIPDGSHIGIKKGELLTLRNLLYGMMLASGDDAANVIAKHVGGTISQFMEGLNAYIKSLGCQQTTFLNPHGLHHPKQKTTAYDMALLAREALKNPILREIMATTRYTRPRTNKQEPSTLVQTNRLLRTGPYYYSKAIGVKTGYYSQAGNTFVAAAKEGERTLIAVLLKTQERKDIFLDAKKMFEAAFNQPKVERVLLHRGEEFRLNIKNGEKPLLAILSKDLVLEYYPAEEQSIKCLLCWNKDLQLPILKNQPVGELIVQTELGQTLFKHPLHAHEDVQLTSFARLKNFFLPNLINSKAMRWAGALIFFFCAFFLISRLGQTRTKRVR